MTLQSSKGELQRWETDSIEALSGAINRGCVMKQFEEATLISPHVGGED